LFYKATSNLEPSVHFRLATPDDIPAVLALEKQADTAAHWSPKQYAEIFAHSAPQRLFLLAEVSAAILGFLIARSAVAEWELENIVVAATARKRGLGARLASDFLARAKQLNASSVFLEVRESNVPARALYEKLGFVENGRRRSYYSQPLEDAILYLLYFV
jgi:ribosomal-protein-alanine N-acetyltransferase